jgi:hypothetical protein
MLCVVLYVHLTERVGVANILIHVQADLFVDKHQDLAKLARDGELKVAHLTTFLIDRFVYKITK